MALRSVPEGGREGLLQREAPPFRRSPPRQRLVLGATVALQSLIVLAIALGAVIALQLFLNRTQTGRRMQATAQNPTVARISASGRPDDPASPS
jgi:branched-chain amino acid transport system permease protein